MTKTTYMIRERWALGSLAARRKVLFVGYRTWYGVEKIVMRVERFQVAVVILAVLIVVAMGVAIVALS